MTSSSFIDSISLNPDTVVAATRNIIELEARLGRPGRDDAPRESE